MFGQNWQLQLVSRQSKSVRQELGPQILIFWPFPSNSELRVNESALFEVKLSHIAARGGVIVKLIESRQLENLHKIP